MPAFQRPSVHLRSSVAAVCFASLLAILLFIANSFYYQLETSLQRTRTRSSRLHIRPGPGYNVDQYEFQPASVRGWNHTSPNGLSFDPAELKEAGKASNDDLNSAYVSYVALCLAVKDDPLDIREWVAYHQSVGIERIYIYDDGSIPPLESLLVDFIEGGLVEYKYLLGPLSADAAQQVAIYSDCLQRHKHKHTWIGAWDSDEFVVIRNGARSLGDVLKSYEQYGGVGVTWRVFGTTAHQTRPPNGLLASYTNCTSLSYVKSINIKSIVNTKYGVAALGPHHFQYKEGYYAVNTNFEKCILYDSPVALEDVLVMNHYFLRSMEDFQKKMIRGTPMGDRKTMGWWELVSSLAVEQCTYAVPLGEELRRRVQIDAGAFLNSRLNPSETPCLADTEPGHECAEAQARHPVLAEQKVAREPELG